MEQLITISEFSLKYGIPRNTILWYLRYHCKGLKPVRILGKTYLFREKEFVECMREELQKRSLKWRNWKPEQTQNLFER